MKKECISMVCTFLALAFFCPAIHAGQGIRTDRKIIVLDPGHGGAESGAVTASGLTENASVLELSTRLSTLLSSDYTVATTRNDDIMVPLQERTATANASKADLFISLHAKPGSRISDGPTCYVYQPPGNGSLPPAETKGQWSNNQLPHIKQSRQAAEILCRALDRTHGQGVSTVVSAPMAVLTGAGMPAVVMEVLFLSDIPEQPQERTEMLNRTALAIAEGIHAFFNSP